MVGHDEEWSTLFGYTDYLLLTPPWSHSSPRLARDVPTHNPIFDEVTAPYGALDFTFDAPEDLDGSSLGDLLNRPISSAWLCCHQFILCRVCCCHDELLNRGLLSFQLVFVCSNVPTHLLPRTNTSARLFEDFFWAVLIS